MKNKLVCKRELFDIPDDTHYLNCAYMSPLLNQLEAIGNEQLKRQKRPFEIGVNDFFEPVDLLKQNFASLLGTSDSQRIAILPSVSYGMANVINNIDLKHGDNIIVAAEQFPSNVYPWMYACQKSGAELRQIVRPEKHNWSDAIITAVDSNTRAVCMAHVHWADGYKFDLIEIANSARDNDALMVIDGTQSIGALAFPFDEVQPDAVICAGYKWLMGSYMLSVGYYGPFFDNKEPIEHNWINRLNSENFKELVNFQPNFKDKANRYSVGEQSNFTLVPVLSAGIAHLLEWEVDSIQAYCKELVSPYLESWRSIGYQIESDSLAYHLFGVRLPAGTSSEGIRDVMQRHNVFVSYRGDAIRVAPHVYNNSRDLDALDSALKEFIGR